MKTLKDILEGSVKKYADQPAVAKLMGYRNVSLNYQEVYDLALKVACFLKQQGVKKGDKVLVLAPNSPYWICVFWGCVLSGAIIVPLNVQSTGEMVKKIADQTKARIFIKYLYFRHRLPKGLKVFDIEMIDDLVSDIDCAGFKAVKLQADDLVQIMYTSGTTGDPKGVMLNHRNMYTNVTALSKTIPIIEQDKFLSILPLSHIYEQVAGFLTPFSRGAELIYVHSPTAIRQLMKQRNISKMLAVPEFLQVIMSKLEGKSSIALIRRILFRIGFGGSLKTVASGGAPLSVELEKKWNQLGVTLLQGYGLTETSTVVSSNSFKYHGVGSIGKILPGVKVKIDKSGEILVKGPNIFQGYYKNPKKTAEVFTKDGWFKTGDLGEFDKQKFLYIKGRKKYMILAPGGQNVYPEDIEEELNKIEAVDKSCVVGLEKANGQVEIHAVLVLKSKAKLESLIRKVNEKLAPYQHINAWTLWPEGDFPRSATRKVKRHQVIEYVRNHKKNQNNSQELKTPLVKLLSEVTGTDVKKIRGNTKVVTQLNLDSLLRVELVARIEEKFAVEIDEALINNALTVAQLEKIIKAKKPVKRRRLKKWLLRPWMLFVRGILRFLFLLFAKIFVKLEVEGEENLEGLDESVLFMPNHVSYLDPVVVLMALPSRFKRKISFAAAEDVLYQDYRYIAWLVKIIFNSFPFPRKKNSNIRYGLERMGQMLDHGFSVVVFPEGKQSLTGKLIPLKKGAGLMAVEMRTEVVPVRIEGSRRVLPPNKIWPRRRGKVVVRFGKPLKFKRGDSYLRAIEKIGKQLV